MSDDTPPRRIRQAPDTGKTAQLATALRANLARRKVAARQAAQLQSNTSNQEDEQG